MTFNIQLKTLLKQHEKELFAKSVPRTACVRKENEKPQPPKICCRRSEKVAGGDILWKPIDRAAAMLLARSPWWAQPPQIVLPAASDTKPKTTKQKRKRRHMKGTVDISGGTMPVDNRPVNGEYTARNGLKIRMVNGEPYFDAEEVDSLICEQISKLPAETRPNVLAAQDARKIIKELLEGIGGEMDKFKANSSMYLNDIRQTRFAVVSETAQMTKELKEVRQFFLGSDYKEQIDRMREFVDLCERLQKLKECGFLDSVADTMLRLA